MTDTEEIERWHDGMLSKSVRQFHGCRLVVSTHLHLHLHLHLRLRLRLRLAWMLAARHLQSD